MTVSEPAEASMMNVVPMSPRRTGPPDDSFAELFAATYPQIVRTVWFVIHDRAAAEEVAQDAFTELFRAWSRLRDFDRPDLWVRRVAIRKAQREATRRTRRTMLEQAATTGPLVEDGVRLPDPDGLGVMDEDGGSRPGMGHEGLQVGFASFARCLYEDGIVITVLTNEESLVTGDIVNALAAAALGDE